MMGAALVGEVLARWTHLPDRQFRVLLRMAHTALDYPNGEYPARLYFGGHDLRAMSLRSPYPEGDDKDAIKAHGTLHRHVRSAVAGLVASGAIQRRGTAYLGHQQEYWVLPSHAGPQKTSYAGPQKTSTEVLEGPAYAGPQEASQGTTTRTTQELSQEIDTSLHTDLEVVGEPRAGELDQSVNGEGELARQSRALYEWMRRQETQS
jgi:hypothetical protein